MLTIALAKGRLAELAMERFAAIGLDCEEMQEKSRKLIFQNPDQQIKFFLAKPGDVPTYVEYGAADIGVAGKDTLLEENRDLYEVYDFGFGECRVAVAGPAGVNTRKNGLRVATKYPAMAADYFESRGVTIELIKLSGSVELAPIVGLSDVIVDIVETGSTLEENGLVVLEEISPITARLIVNRVSMKLEYERVTEIIRKLKINSNTKNDKRDE
ncbi:MAG: ATP phosphoribosyltransferase [Defluviitaleaceae bacterium]|nr:ATP phosphoribosyltransferase [Defluviitaleaceae bacterium]